MTEPDRVVIFRVTWEDDAGNVRRQPAPQRLPTRNTNSPDVVATTHGTTVHIEAIEYSCRPRFTFLPRARSEPRERNHRHQ